MVEPACERQRVGRVETMVRVSGVLWSGSGYRARGGFDSGCSFLATRLNQLGGEVLATRLNRLREGGSWPGSTSFGGSIGVREKSFVRGTSYH